MVQSQSCWTFQSEMRSSLGCSQVISRHTPAPFESGQVYADASSWLQRHGSCLHAVHPQLSEHPIACWPQARREAEKRALAEARREKKAELKRAASKMERDQAKAAEAAAAAAEPMARAANGRSSAAAAPGRGGGRGRTRSPATPETDSKQDFDTGFESGKPCICLHCYRAMPVAQRLPNGLHRRE